MIQPRSNQIIINRLVAPISEGLVPTEGSSAAFFFNKVSTFQFLLCLDGTELSTIGRIIIADWLNFKVNLYKRILLGDPVNIMSANHICKLKYSHSANHTHILILE